MVEAELLSTLQSISYIAGATPTKVNPPAIKVMAETGIDHIKAVSQVN